MRNANHCLIALVALLCQLAIVSARSGEDHWVWRTYNRRERAFREKDIDRTRDENKLKREPTTRRPLPGEPENDEIEDYVDVVPSTTAAPSVATRQYNPYANLNPYGGFGGQPGQPAQPGNGGQFPGGFGAPGQPGNFGGQPFYPSAYQPGNIGFAGAQNGLGAGGYPGFYGGVGAGYPGVGATVGAGYPGSQSGAGYPGSQSVAGYPGSQPGASYPGSQAGYGTGYPGGQPGVGTGYPGGQPGLGLGPAQFPGAGSQYPFGSYPGAGTNYNSNQFAAPGGQYLGLGQYPSNQYAGAQYPDGYGLGIFGLGQPGLAPTGYGGYFGAGGIGYDAKSATVPEGKSAKSVAVSDKISKKV